MNELCHVGTKRHSGRFPWGSGEDPYQHEGWSLHKQIAYLYDNGLKLSEIARGLGINVSTVQSVMHQNRISELKAKGITKDTAIAKALGITTTELRKINGLAKEDVAIANSQRVLKLRAERQMSTAAISRALDIPETTVRNMLDPYYAEKNQAYKKTADMLKQQVEKTGYLDIGDGEEIWAGLKRTEMLTAVKLLKNEGYEVNNIRMPQLTMGEGKKTDILVLSKPGTTIHDVYEAAKRLDISTLADYSDDGGLTYARMDNKIQPPVKIAQNRILIRYAEEGGANKDGVIELRRGVSDLSLGENQYGQARIGVEGDLYLKGMCMYGDNDKMPSGVDIIFNTNKSKGTAFEDVLKEMKTGDPLNPFGATFKQRNYIGEDGQEHLSAINLVNEQGTWEGWSKNIASQVLSKQSTELAKRQLGMTLDKRKQEFEEINSLTNPVLKKQLLEEFADSCDSDAVHLKAAALPRQATKVLLPVDSLKDNEVYAPSFNDGETVVLVRYPHAGRFESPELIVNNRNREANRTITKAAEDAIGINSKVAQQLSGADFDGDSVLVIPNNPDPVTGQKLFAVDKRNENLINFDPKIYKVDKKVRVTVPRGEQEKNMEMGKISNLITDMTLHGADPSGEEMERAVKASMVVIDSLKHNLDYKAALKDYRISELKQKYQGKSTAGASTLISRAKSEVDVPDRKEIGINKETGEKMYLYTGKQKMGRKKIIEENGNETWVDSGKMIDVTKKSTKMYETKDARTLSSGTVMEEIYAKHANELKALANNARKISVNTTGSLYNEQAAKTYAKEVESIKAKLQVAKAHAPAERQVTLIANAKYARALSNDPSLKNNKDGVKKLKNRCVAEAREMVGPSKSQTNVKITDREWEAMQAGAFRNQTMKEVFKNTNKDALKAKAMPKTSKGLSDAQVDRAIAMLMKGNATRAEVAKSLGVSVSQLNYALDQ